MAHTLSTALAAAALVAVAATSCASPPALDRTSVAVAPAPGAAPPTPTPTPTPEATSGPARSGAAVRSGSTARATSTTAPTRRAAPSSSQPPTRPRAAHRVPGDLLDLGVWKLTLPTGDDGPDEIENPELATYRSAYMRLTEARDGVVFTATTGGTTTSGSKYPRSELREMTADGEKAAWDGRRGTHVMEVRQAITRIPTAKPEMVAGQIHGPDDDLLLIHLSGRALRVKYLDDGSVDLDRDYRLGTPFTVKIVGTGGRTQVFYNGTKKFDEAISTPASYFKAGSYCQSNAEKGDPDATCQVVVYSLSVRHS